jgi:hypothetical protein
MMNYSKPYENIRRRRRRRKKKRVDCHWQCAVRAEPRITI